MKILKSFLVTLLGLSILGGVLCLGIVVTPWIFVGIAGAFLFALVWSAVYDHMYWG